LALKKGLGKNPEISVSRVIKSNTGAGVEAFSIRTQDAWTKELDGLLEGNGMVQG
jgi:hypothetical protein